MISVAQLINELGYAGSPNFVTGDDLRRVPGYGHIFRRAQQPRKEGEKSCGLRGVYALRQRPSDELVLGQGSLTPVVYVCEAESETEADHIHRLVWNQDVVPFLIVGTPQNIRVYSGFGHRHRMIFAASHTAVQGKFRRKALRQIRRRAVSEYRTHPRPTFLVLSVQSALAKGEPRRTQRRKASSSALGLRAVHDLHPADRAA